MLEIGFENAYFQVFRGFPALKETVAHIQPNGQFWTVFGQNLRNRIFFKKVFGTFFLLLKALINCKVSEKSNEGIPRNRVWDERTDEQTNEAVTNIFYLSSAFRICTGCLPKYDWNLLKIGFKNTYFQVFQGFPALKETHPHIQPNGQF